MTTYETYLFKNTACKPNLVSSFNFQKEYILSRHMIIVDQVVVSDEILEEHFACDLSACKGACCVAGEGGAPLESSEIPVLEEIYPRIKPYLAKEGKKVLREKGLFVEESDGSFSTPLIDGKECAYLVYENGIAFCGIEKAWKAGAIDFQKPISCHLYPIRISEKRQIEILQYHRWHICKPGCKNGAKEKILLYRFLKNAIVRKYGEEFYRVLEEIATQKKNSETTGKNKR